jgi:hypothetical protein
MVKEYLDIALIQSGAKLHLNTARSAKFPQGLVAK